MLDIKKTLNREYSLIKLKDFLLKKFDNECLSISVKRNLTEDFNSDKIVSINLATITIKYYNLEVLHISFKRVLDDTVFTMYSKSECFSITHRDFSHIKAKAIDLVKALVCKDSFGSLYHNLEYNNGRTKYTNGASSYIMSREFCELVRLEDDRRSKMADDLFGASPEYLEKVIELVNNVAYDVKLKYSIQNLPNNIKQLTIMTDDEFMIELLNVSVVFPNSDKRTYTLTSATKPTRYTVTYNSVSRLLNNIEFILLSIFKKKIESKYNPTAINTIALTEEVIQDYRDNLKDLVVENNKKIEQQSIDIPSLLTPS